MSSQSLSQTGLFFDSRCLLHQCNYNHAESPQRIIATYEKLVNSGLWNRCLHLQLEGFSVIDSFQPFQAFIPSPDCPQDFATNGCLRESKFTTGLSTPENDKGNNSSSFPTSSTHNKLLYGSQTLCSIDTTINLESILQKEQHYCYQREGSMFPQPIPRLTPNLLTTAQFNPLYTTPRPIVAKAIFELVHSRNHIDFVSQTFEYEFGPDELDSETDEDTTLYPDCKFLTDDTYVNKYSAEAAFVGASGVVELTRAVCEGLIANGVAVIRPPGHHAGSIPGIPFAELMESKQGIMGFCLFNNIAIAAKMAQKEFPKTIRKVLIVDFDVHHGNGTQNIFYDDDSVLFFSIHRYTPGFFPETGNYIEIGEKKGLGMTVNFPVQTTLATDTEYLTVFNRLFLPIAHAFQPDLILISAGMDLLAGDPIGEMSITPHCLHQIISLLQQVNTHHGDSAQDGPWPARMVVCLEGGYNPDVVANGMVEITNALINPQSTVLTTISSCQIDENTQAGAQDGERMNKPEIIALYTLLDTVIQQFSQYYPLK